jgi:hypothetical protein
MADFTSYFEIDPETKNWVLKAGKNINDFLTEEYGGKVPNWITKAFSASEAQREVDNALDKSSKGDSITNTIGGLIKDASNVTLNTLVSLYEDIHGEGTFKDSGLLTDY